MKLPDELYEEIFSHLSQHHLRSVSQTCRAFATIVKPLMFATIHLDGSPHSQWGKQESHALVWYPGRRRTADLGTLESTVDELIAHDIAPHVQNLKFSPGYYVDRFWSAYDLLLSDFEEPYEFNHGEGAFETNTKCVHRCCRRNEEEQLQRLPHCTWGELFERAEAIWAAKAEEQREKADAIPAALIKLFVHMPRLKAIEVQEWHCNLGDYDMRGDNRGEVFAGCSTTWKYLELLSSAVQASKTRVQSLVLPKIHPSSITTSAALEHMFSSLTALSFPAENVDFVFESSNNEAQPLAALLRCSSETLQTLEFRMTTSDPQPPDEGEHHITRLFGSVSATNQTDTTPLVFRALTTLKLRGLILDTPSLISFLSQQPQLRYAHFEHIYLAPTGYQWSDVAENLPPSCNKLYIGKCRHEKYKAGAPGEYGYDTRFMPCQEPMQPKSGWQLNEQAVQRELDAQIQRYVDRGLSIETFWGKPIEDYMATVRSLCDHAEFERI